MHPAAPLQRVRLRITGAVQGVGFRPFVYRLAHELAVHGWVSNDPAGVTIEAEADQDTLARFTTALRTQAPPRAHVHDVVRELLEPSGATSFRIVESDVAGRRSAAVLPDIAPCAECLREIQTPSDRRSAYAFTNCTCCGPRFSIIRALPYDRPNTAMADFRMCGACTAEYHEPLNRRFHAQPNACPDCGPRVELWDAAGRVMRSTDPIEDTARALAAGLIVAVKGIGGFHVVVDAANEDAVAELRRRKRRPFKPLAVMAPSLAHVRRFATVHDDAAELLQAPEAPIVLLPRRTARAFDVDGAASVDLAEGVAPGNPRIGAMLPSSPLHHLLLGAFGAPVVATSGNLAEEPICTDEREAVQRLAGIADLFLVHDRPIERHVDDSVAMYMDGAPRLLRRARGYAPLPVLAPHPLPPILAVGAQLKNTIALSRDRQVFISQHIGDVETFEAQQAFERVVADFLRLYDTHPAAIAHDLHPDYATTRFAERLAFELRVPRIGVQHHHAHLASCLAENGVTGPALGVVWDGTGYGTDGTIWGGEFLLGDAHAYARVAHLLPFRLPGGAAAVRQPWRTALALLYGAFGADALLVEAPDVAPIAGPERRTIRHMLETGLNAPVTTSAGRLFDGISALLGLCRTTTFEGEAAIRLEHVASAREYGAYDIGWSADAEPAVLDWRPVVRAVVADAQRGVSVAVIAARVHNAFAAAIALQAELVNCERVALTGGCFQNRLLLERTTTKLRHNGFAVLQHSLVPANDGGVSLGQVAVAAARLCSSDSAPAAATAAATPKARMRLSSEPPTSNGHVSRSTW